MSNNQDLPAKNPDLNEEDDSDEEDDDYVPSGDEAGSSSSGDFDPFWPHHFGSHVASYSCLVSRTASEESGEGEDEGDFDDIPKSSGTKRKLQEEDTTERKESKLSEEEEKKRADELWAMFNDEEEDIKPKPAPSVPVVTSKPVVETKPVKAEEKNSILVETNPIVKEEEEDLTVKEETTPEIPQKESLRDTPSVSKPIVPPAKKSGGLSSLVSRLGNKKKESTLIKSKNDWQRYKEDEGIVEELTEHTKSKDSFVEKQAFLQRADLRQFEQEKSVRDKIRSKKLP